MEKPPFLSNKTAIIAYGFSDHYLDHLAPLAILWDLPFICTEHALYQKAKQFYPSLNIHYFDLRAFFPFVVKQFDMVISCFGRNMIEADFGLTQDLMGQEVTSIWCPHGNSDKGLKTTFFEGLSSEKHLLVYGKKMLKILHKKNVNEVPYSHIGNYRYNYYQKNIDFYQNLLSENLLSKLPKAQENWLYCPTWEDHECSCSFFHFYDTIIKSIPKNTNLIIKLHPNTFVQKQNVVEEIKGRFEDQENIFFLEDFPTIYPLLDFCDAYVGDASSIGYDFLTFYEKPMILLRNEKNPFHSDLFSCSHLIKKTDRQSIKELFSKLHVIDKEKKYVNKRQALYQHTFYVE